MEVKSPDVYGLFKKFPPFYTEQINDVALCKQLEIWEALIRDYCSKGGLYVVNVDDNEAYPFNNATVNRKVNRSFMILIAQHLVERGFGFYLHPITEFCKTNECSVWGALFIGKKVKTNQVRNLHDLEYQTLTANVNKTGSALDILKAKRNLLASKHVVVGIFEETIEETAEGVLRYLRSHLPGNKVETPYYLFYGGRESMKQYQSWPEEHVAMILSLLVTKKQVALTLNMEVPQKTLNSKQLGVQII